MKDECMTSTSGYTRSGTMINELNELARQLPESINFCKKWGKKAAESKRDYYIAKEQATLKYKADGMAATLIPLVVKGECAKELYEMEFSQIMYDSAKENVNSLKYQIKILELQISMEWGESKNG